MEYENAQNKRVNEYSRLCFGWTRLSSGRLCWSVADELRPVDGADKIRIVDETTASSWHRRDATTHGIKSTVI